MPATPIFDAEKLVQEAVATAIRIANPTVRFYWQEDGVNRQKPYLRAQLQSDVGTAHKINRGGATGLVSVFAVADTRSAAQDLLATIAVAIESVSVAGYNTSFQYVRSPRSLFDGLAYNIGHAYRFILTKPPGV